MKTRVGKHGQGLESRTRAKDIRRHPQRQTSPDLSSEADYEVTQAQRLGRWSACATPMAPKLGLQQKTELASAQRTVLPNGRKPSSPERSIQRVIIEYEKDKSVPAEAIEHLTEEQKSQIERLHGHKQRYPQHPAA